MTPRRGHLVLANGAAGTADERVVIEAARRLGDAEVVATASPEDVDGALARLDGRSLVVAGGDGSLHVALQHLHDLGLLPQVRVGLLPLGTGNDFARGVGIPLDPVAAAEAVAAGAERTVDLLLDDEGGVLVNAAHAGVGAAAAEAASGLKPRLGALAYPVGAVVAGVREAERHLRVDLDGERVHDGPALLVGVLNGPCIGGGTRLCTRARPDDGRLDVVVAFGVAPAARIAFGAALRAGTHLDREDVLHARGAQVRISGDPVAHDVDGEVLDETRDRTYRVVASAWRLLGAPGRSPAGGAKR